MNEEEQYIDAAKQIREDPELPAELAPELDKLLKATDVSEGDERGFVVDALVVRLRRHAWTSDRLDALALGGERAAITWTDGVLPGEDDGPSDALKLKCLATGCGFINTVDVRPPDDEMPQCQNPSIPTHTLVL